jgi:acetoacetyl-CoA synthetase
MKQAIAPLVDVLTPIWQRVLGLPSIDAEDNFFDLGGDSALALELFTEIGRVCSRELPPVVIYQAPTVAALAALLEQPASLRLPTTVLMKAGSKNPAVFLAHGLGGTVIDLFQPVKHIESDHPIYGLQAKGMEGVEEPLDSVEDMARFYIDGIKQVQPRGPYVLIGYSLGGLVTLEMAQRLSANGEKVALLCLIDAYPHLRYLSLGQRTRIAARQAKRGLSIFGNLSGSAPYQPPSGVSFSPAMQRVRDRAYLALTRYRPRFYGGKIKFVRAAVSTNFPDDPRAVWGRLADQFEVETIPGDHLGIITTYFENLAEVLSRYLKEAIRES